MSNNFLSMPSDENEWQTVLISRMLYTGLYVAVSPPESVNNNLRGPPVLRLRVGCCDSWSASSIFCWQNSQLLKLLRHFVQTDDNVDRILFASSTLSSASFNCLGWPLSSLFGVTRVFWAIVVSVLVILAQLDAEIFPDSLMDGSSCLRRG